ncbi:hypothetical protein L873DRAFT_1842728 [Choiromyces venosus 120613-1]|uniref:Uncharacterized protein n=1 Tax=Choiromyces venosus 120613-1 TaxID=1336337 RepID=A0A3N4JRW0_9PEZI|nr:hypothetical protein L873DRAFT_1842728 [Choiromyces venosus 120613-1]
MSTSYDSHGLLRENRWLQEKLGEAEKKLEKWVRGVNQFVPLSLRSPSPEMDRNKSENLRENLVKKRGMDDRAPKFLEEKGKRRKLRGEEVGGRVDPEGLRGKQLPVMVKVNGVLWEDGIGGVLEGLRKAGIVSCEGSHWLVGEEERKRRREKGANSSTVLAKIRGAGVATNLCRSGLWVGGCWCSVRRFVAVPPKAKEGVWTRVRGAIIEEREKGVEGRMKIWEVLVGLKEKLEKVVERREREKDRARLVMVKLGVVQERIETLEDVLFGGADREEEKVESGKEEDEEMEDEKSEESGVEEEVIRAEVVKRVSVFGYGKEDQLLEVQRLRWYQFERKAWEIEVLRAALVLEEERKKEREGEKSGEGSTGIKKKKKKGNKGKGMVR